MTLSRFTVEPLHFNTATRAEVNQIQYVYETVYQTDILVTFNPALDADWQAPDKDYSAAVKGAYFVVRDREDGRRIVGTAGLRHIAELGNQCELKRMFFLPVCRGQGLGMEMCKAIISKAVDLKYDAVVLETKRHLDAANRLYEKCGFVDCENYNGQARCDRFMRLDLSRCSPGAKL